MFEYLSDLNDYYRNSYGSESVTKQLPCLMVRNMLDAMNDSKTSNKVTALFTHSPSILLFLTSLGVFKDDNPLLGNNFIQQRNRKFKTNQICPFASNFAAVQYKCRRTSNKVLFLLNQKPLRMEWCRNGSICTVQEIWKMYKKSSMYGNCLWNKICETSNETLT